MNIIISSTGSDPFNGFRRHRVKLRESDDSFGYFGSLGQEQLPTPPLDKLMTVAIPYDLFVHRVLCNNVIDVQQMQIWMLVPSTGGSLRGDSTWEPVMVGTRKMFGGTEHVLGVDPIYGRPYWYFTESFMRYVARDSRRG